MDSQKNNNWFLLRKMIMDLVFLIIVGVAIMLFYFVGSPYERGFFCEDESLKYTFKESTISSSVLYGIGYSLPICIMCLTEWIHLRNTNGGQNRVIFGVEIPTWVWEAYRVIGVFLFGCACQQLTTDIAKYTIGRLRPHFFEVCQPDINCTLPENRLRYIENFNCLGDNRRRLKEMRLSFPSGHSSFSVFAMFFLAFYIQKRFSWRGSKLLRHFLQLVVVMMAWYTCLSRISDNKHHWSDVLAGFLIGLFYAIVVFLFMYKPNKLELRYTALIEPLPGLPRPMFMNQNERQNN